MDYSKAIFVFGSNEAGLHGAGAAAFAHRRKGAILHQAEGLQGRSYGIPTKDKFIRETLSLDKIKTYVDTFIKYAEEHTDSQFQVTCIGCGLAGLKHQDIAPMFVDAPDNCWFDDNWNLYLGPKHKYWGTF